MKNIYKNLLLGTALTVCAAVPTFAQDPCADIEANTALYNKYIANYDKGIEQQKVAVEAGKEYIQKYESCATKDAAGVETKTFAEQVKYFKESVPVLEKGIADDEKRKKDEALYGRFTTAFRSKTPNIGEIIESGKAIFAVYPNDKDALDISIVIASAAFDELNAKNTSAAYNADLITYAKKAIDLIESGKTSKSHGYGAFSLGPDKNKALGILNYSIALAMLNDPAMKKDASLYFYKSSQYNSPFKNVALPYRAIGANYLDEFIKIDNERKAKLKESNNVDTPETLAMEAMQKGIADRAIEAYARAYKIAAGDAKQKATADAVSTTLKDLYAFRYDGKTIDNLNTYTTTVAAKTLTDPKAEIVPVKEEVPPTTPTPATTDPATKPATAPATTPTKPETSSTTAPAKPETGTTAKTTAPKAKKPAPKKKGTR